MIRRILVIGSIALAVAGGARLALEELTERAWQQRKRELLELALFPAQERRPWEVRFDSLAERVRSSPRFDEIVSSPYGAHNAWGAGEPRSLNEFERVWLESWWAELGGLDAVIRALRERSLAELEWHGDTASLALSRGITNALCGQAWLALESGDSPAASLAYGDALRLARATDDGTFIGTTVRTTSEGIVLRAVRAALAFGASPAALRAQLAPFLEALAYDPERAERTMRRDLTMLVGIEELAEPWDDPAWLLGYFAPVEEALAQAREPFARPASRTDEERPWHSVIGHLHAWHARSNVALTALAVAAFHELHGRYPSSLGELGDLPGSQGLDPLTGAPLPYSPSGAGARVGPAAWAELDGERGSDPEESLFAWLLR
jgi:hypothetical protein